MGITLIISALVVFGVLFSPINADPVEDKQALLDFLHNIGHSQSLVWNASSSVCKNWTGVTCNDDHSRVVALRLAGLGIHGRIPPNTLSRLSAIRILSLESNFISGSFPSGFLNLKNLTILHLQSNNFSGPLPLDFSVWSNLTVLDLSYNGFSGSIPSSISNMPHITALNLANNFLSGDIPDINVPSLQQLDLANNNLTGTVPKSLERFPGWAFSGNHLSSENALSPALQVHPPAKPSRKQKKLSKPAILGIVLGGCVAGFVVIALLIVCRYSMKEREGMLTTNLHKKEAASEKNMSESQDKNNKLVFFEDSSLAFDLEDLLRASAEVLGKGTFGITYKAALEDATTVVVKRLKEVAVGKKEFEQQMQVVGSIRHLNVSPMRAYYYSKDERLTVSDYYEQGSVSALLHGDRVKGQNSLDWETRLRIAIGAARGITHIHTQNGGKLVHGNIKSSNIFLNSQGFGCVSDIGLATLMSPMSPPVTRAAGYRAPEVTDTGKATRASDVYSYGVLLLELLTGKSPMHASGGDEEVHLVRWVNSVVREEWTAEVFDVGLLRYPNIEEEMVEMLQIGLACVARTPERRPKMPDVQNMVEDIRRVDRDIQPSPGTNPEIALSTPTLEAGSGTTLYAPQ